MHGYPCHSCWYHTLEGGSCYPQQYDEGGSCYPQQYDDYLVTAACILNQSARRAFYDGARRRTLHGPLRSSKSVLRTLCTGVRMRTPVLSQLACSSCIGACLRDIILFHYMARFSSSEWHQALTLWRHLNIACSHLRFPVLDILRASGVCWWPFGLHVFGTGVIYFL